MKNILKISVHVQDNKKNIAIACHESLDLSQRELTLPNGKQALIVFLDGLIDKSEVGRLIIFPISKLDSSVEISPEDLTKELISAPNFIKNEELDLVIDDIVSGGVAMFIEGYDYAISFDLRKWLTRGISEPATERVVRGPREGFVETGRLNMSMLRRKIRNRNLVFENMKIGKQSKTEIIIAYIADIARPEMVQEVKKRLEGIDMGSVLESGYIEEMIEDNPYSIFPTVGNSEKPDKVAGKILEGRVAIIVEGTPVVLTVPNLFIENFQSSEDYYSRPFYVSVVRMLRYFAMFTTIYLPALYIAITTYNQELIPYSLMLSAVISESGTPFPVGFSVLLMSLIYEILREGGVRLPAPAGQTIGIVGALIIGDAAVSAGLISQLVVIVVAFTAISSFLITPLLGAATILRFFYIFLALTSGFYGIILGTIFVQMYLMSLRSLGVPYTMPYAPYVGGQIRDTFIRYPWWMLGKRPEEFTDNIKRQGENQKPEPPVNGEGISVVLDKFKEEFNEN